MTIEELRERLRAIRARQDEADPTGPDGRRGPTAADHEEADELLLAYVDDEEARAAFESLIRWYD